MQSLASIEENHFIGVCDRYPSHIIPNGLFTKADNALVDNNSISKRRGNTAVAATLGAFDILGGSAFELANGTKYQIVVLNGSSNARAYSWTGSGAFSTLGLANLAKDAQMNFVQASDSLFGFNGTDVIDINSSLSLTKDRAGVPKGKFGVWFHNYLFTAGVTATPNRLFWSNLGAPTTFTGSDYIDINANDGDVITGLAVFNDELYVFKNNTIWSITGWSGSTFGATTIAGQNTNSRIFGYGTSSHRSIINTGRNLYYLSFLGGIPHFRDLGLTVFATTVDQGIVSLDIETTMNGVNKSQLAKCAGTYDGKLIRWAIPNGSSTFNSLVLNFRPDIQLQSPLGIHRSWTTSSGISVASYWMSTISGRSKIYWGDADTAGLINEADTSVYTDNGTAISMDVRTKDYMFDPNKKSKFKYSYLRYKSGSAGSLQYKARIDKAVDFSLQETLSLQGNSPGLGPTGTFTLGVSILGGSDTVRSRVTLQQLTGGIFGIQFKEVTANFCDIYDYSILGLLKGLRDE